MLGAKAGGPGYFSVRVTQAPKSNRRKAQYVFVLSQRQWDNMLARIQKGETEIYGVHKILHETTCHKPETLNPV